MFNLSNWQLYIEVLKIDQSVIAAFVLPYAGIIGLVLLVFLSIELRSWKNYKYFLAGLAVLGAAFTGLYFLQQKTLGTAHLGGKPMAAVVEPTSLKVVGVSLALLCLYAVIRHIRKDKSLPGIAFLTPAVPLLLVLVAHWEIIPAFMAGIAVGVLSTWQRDSVNTLTRSIIEGAATVAPAVVLMLGIGMLLAAVMDPAVSGAIAPILTDFVPRQPMTYVIAFTVLAPLALYRGPLSLWGMGSGIVALIQKAGVLPGPAVMSMLMSVGQLQGICDPTNTHNVWIATYLGTDTQSLLRRTLPYAWTAVFTGLVLSTIFGYVR